MLLAAMMVLGMVPAVSMAVTAEETAQAATPLWSADFEDPDKVYDKTGTNSVWKHFSPNEFFMTVKEEASGNHYLHIAGDTSEGKVGTTFVLRNKPFAPQNAVVMSVDLYRSDATTDGMKIAIETAGNAGIASLLIWPKHDGRIDYNSADFGVSGGTWTSTGVSIGNGEWVNLTIVLIQSETEGQDKLIISCGGQTKTITGTLRSSNVAEQFCLTAPGSTGYHAQIDNLGIDNMAVYACDPVTAASFAAATYEVDAGKTVQTAVVTTPAAPVPGVSIAYASDNEAVATVDNKGLVTGVAGGTANITATVTDLVGNTATATAAVTVSAPVVPVDAAVSTPVWSADFDDPGKVYDKQFTQDANAVWKEFNPKQYSVTVGEETDGNHYLRIVSGTTGDAFVLRSTNFTPMDRAVVTVDLFRQSAGTDGFQISFEDGNNHTLAQIFIWPQLAKISFKRDYFEGKGTNWQDVGMPVSYGQWESFRLAVIQSDIAGEDQLIISYGGKTHVEKGTFVTSGKAANILINCPGGYQSVITDTHLDNLAVYPYIPAEAVTLDKEAAALEVADTLELNATVASNASCITAVEWSSSADAVATVDQNGKVTAAGAGEAVITVTVTNADGSQVSDSVTVTVKGESNAQAEPVLSITFDDPAKDYLTADGDVWSGVTMNTYEAALLDRAEGNKYLQLKPKEGQTGKAFAFQTESFTGSNRMYFSFDVYRSAADKDVMYFTIKDAAGAYVMQLFLNNKGKLSYDPYYLSNKDKTGYWSGTAENTIPVGWTTVHVLVEQNAEVGQDVLKLYVNDNRTPVVSAAGTFLSNGNPAAVNIGTPGGWEPNQAGLGVDNIEGYAVVDITGLAFEQTVYEIGGGESLQLSAKLTPANAYPTALSFTSSDSKIASVDAKGIVTGVMPGTVTITATAPSGVTATATVTVTGYGDVTVWEEDFEDWAIDSNGGFAITNNQPHLGSIKVEDASAVGGDGKALVLRRYPDITKITLLAKKQLPEPMAQVVFEYDIMDAQGGHGNMRMAMPTKDGTEAGSQIALGLAGMVAYNAGVRTTTKNLGVGVWRHIKLIMNTDTGVWSLWMDGELLGSGTTLRNNEPMQYVFFQAAYELQDVSNGVWYDNFKVSIHVPAEGVELTEENVTLHGAESHQLVANLTPAGANDQLVYISSDPSVAVVDSQGVITGVSAGTATVTAKVADGIEDTVQVTVETLPPTDIQLNVDSITLPAGAHTWLTATVVPDAAMPNTVTFASSDKSIVTVDEYGEILCLKAGTATITAICGDVSKSISVTVGDPAVMKTIQVTPDGTSIADALAQIATVNATEAKMTGNIVVELADGYYYIDETIKMNELHGGTNGYSVIWKAAEGATPIIGGGKYFSGSLFADADNDGIYTVDLSALGIAKVADPDTMATTRQLFVNNVRATRARSEGGLTNAYYYMDGGVNRGHVSEDEYLADFARVQDLEFVYQELWTHPRAGVAGIVKNGDGTINITMDQPGWNFASNKSASSCGSDGPRWIENALELLDQPGEWYLNEETQILYYMPRSWENMADATFMLPLMDDYDPDGAIRGLMHIEGTDYDNMVYNIRFEGITFADTTWTRPSTQHGHSDAQNNHIRESGDRLPDAAITVAKANGVCFTGCTFTRLGITAVKMVRGVQNSHFVGNHFYDISGSAINIGDPSYGNANVSNPTDLRMMMKNDDVLNNYIHNIGVDFNSSAAISLGFGADMDFNYNELFNMPYSGYHIGYGWQTRFENNLKNLVIGNNFIHDFMGDGVADGGGVYTLGNSSGDGYNKIHSNYIKTVLDNAGPLYCDEGSTYYELYNNLVDLSKVTNGWSGGTVKLSWLQMNAASHHLWVHDNFATVSKYNWNSTDSDIENAQLEDPNNWSAGAQAVIDGAGLQSEYAHLRNGHAELIVVNLEDGADLKAGDVFQLTVSYTDGKDRPVSGGNYICAFDTTTPDILEVTADGKVTSLKQGVGVVRIWVVSNDVLDVIEKTVYVQDEIESVILENFEGKDTLSMSDEADGIALKPYAVTQMGRTMKPNADQYTITVADESIAKIVDGVLIPVSVGNTPLTVKVEMDGLSGEVTYKVEITLAKTFTVDYLEDLFNSDKKDWTNANNAATWEQVEDTSLTTKLYGWTTYSGRTFENELLTFKLKLDITQTGGWPCIVIRADSATTNSAGGGASGYVLCFGGASKNGTIELQRWNAKTRTMIIGDLEGFVPTSGIYNLPHGVDDGEEHLIQFGALTDGGKTRLVLYIDGVQKLDFMDDSEDALTAPGYFGIIGRNEVYYLSHASAEDSYLSAAIGGKMYNDFQDALNEAKPGETVKLLADAEAEGVLIKEGIGLDLNGHDLTADYLVAFAGSQVRDSIGGGLLKSRNVRLAADNAQMPVWVEEDGGYRFFTMKDSQLYYSQSATGFVFIAKPVLGKAANAPYMALANNGLSVKARMSWKSAAGNDVEQFFVLKGEDVQSIYSDKNQIIQLTVNGAGSYIGRLSTTMVIESDTGVIWAGVPLLYTGN